MDDSGSPERILGMAVVDYQEVEVVVVTPGMGVEVMAMRMVALVVVVGWEGVFVRRAPVSLRPRNIGVVLKLLQMSNFLSFATKIDVI